MFNMEREKIKIRSHRSKKLRKDNNIKLPKPWLNWTEKKKFFIFFLFETKKSLPSLVRLLFVCMFLIYELSNNIFTIIYEKLQWSPCNTISFIRIFHIDKGIHVLKSLLFFSFFLNILVLTGHEIQYNFSWSLSNVNQITQFPKAFFYHWRKDMDWWFAWNEREEEKKFRNVSNINESSNFMRFFSRCARQIEILTLTTPVNVMCDVM